MQTGTKHEARASDGTGIRLTWGNDYSLDEEEDPKLLDRHTAIVSSALESEIGKHGDARSKTLERFLEDLRKYGLDYPIEELTILLVSISKTSSVKSGVLTKQRSPADVIPALSGRWLGKFAKLGQIAVMQLFRKSPAWTCAREMLRSLPSVC